MARVHRPPQPRPPVFEPLSRTRRPRHDVRAHGQPRRNGLGAQPAQAKGRPGRREARDGDVPENFEPARVLQVSWPEARGRLSRFRRRPVIGRRGQCTRRVEPGYTASLCWIPTPYPVCVRRGRSNSSASRLHGFLMLPGARVRRRRRPVAGAGSSTARPLYVQASGERARAVLRS